MSEPNIDVNAMNALTRRLDEIESRNSMRDLVSNYCHGLTVEIGIAL